MPCVQETASRERRWNVTSSRRCVVCVLLTSVSGNWNRDAGVRRATSRALRRKRDWPPRFPVLQTDGLLFIGSSAYVNITTANETSYFLSVW